MEWTELYMLVASISRTTATHSITTFTDMITIMVSEALDAQPGINGNEALHTAAVYTTEYVGECNSTSYIRKSS